MPKVPAIYPDFLGARVKTEMAMAAKKAAQSEGKDISAWLREVITKAIRDKAG